jgi:acyl carrier protein
MFPCGIALTPTPCSSLNTVNLHDARHSMRHSTGAGDGANPEDTTNKGGHFMKTALRRILSESARLDVSPDTLADDADLYAAGLSSLATVHLMLAIEDEFGIEIPDRMLTRRLFSSIDSLAAAVTELQQAQAAA